MTDPNEAGYLIVLGATPMGEVGVKVKRGSQQGQVWLTPELARVHARDLLAAAEEAERAALGSTDQPGRDS